MPIIWGWTIQGCTSEWRLVWSDKHLSSSPWLKLIPTCAELYCEEPTRISFSVFQCALNILKGNVTLKPAEKARLTKYRQKLRKVADKKVSLKQKHKIVQTGGFAPALLAPLLAPVIAPLAKQVIGGLFGGKIWNHGQGDAFGRPKDVATDVDSNKSSSPHDSHIRSGHASCAGQARSQWWGQSETLQPNIATLPGIPRSSEKHSCLFIRRCPIKQHRARSP